MRKANQGIMILFTCLRVYGSPAQPQMVESPHAPPLKHGKIHPREFAP